MGINVREDGFIGDDELHSVGFKSVGKNVKISRFARIYQPSMITIGDNVRIDDFVKMNGKIIIGSNVHISSFVCLMGSFGIKICDFSQISLRATLLSATDDFSGEHLVGPQVESHLRQVTGGEIVLEKHALVGAGSLLFPSVTMREGAALGAMSSLISSAKKWTIYLGNPAKPVGQRSCKLLDLEKMV